MYYNKVEICGVNTSKLKTLTDEEKTELLQRAKKGDMEARQELIYGNLRLVLSIIQRFTGRRDNMDDLFQVGCIGLIKAVDNFNTELNVKFSTYAVPMIMGEIRRYLRDDGPVKVSRSLKEINRRAMAASERLEMETGLTPGVRAIAEAIGESPEDVALALESARATISLNAPIGEDEDGATRQDVLPDEAREEALVDRLLIKELLGRLDARERQIIVLRYFRDCTQARVAEMIGVSQVQVSRLESRILKKLRLLAEAAREA